jgi:TldD protein
MQFSESIFATRFNITRRDLESYLAEALSQGGDYADLYFEYLLTSSIGIDESMVKSAMQGVSIQRDGHHLLNRLCSTIDRSGGRIRYCR